MSERLSTWHLLNKAQGAASRAARRTIDYNSDRQGGYPFTVFVEITLISRYSSSVAARRELWRQQKHPYKHRLKEGRF